MKCLIASVAPEIKHLRQLISSFAKVLKEYAKFCRQIYCLNHEIITTVEIRQLLRMQSWHTALCQDQHNKWLSHKKKIQCYNKHTKMRILSATHKDNTVYQTQPKKQKNHNQILTASLYLYSSPEDYNGYFSEQHALCLTSQTER